jgi:hypothetical protein
LVALVHWSDPCHHVAGDYLNRRASIRHVAGDLTKTNGCLSFRKMPLEYGIRSCRSTAKQKTLRTAMINDFDPPTKIAALAGGYF